MSADMQLQVVASLLRRGRTLDNLSTGFTLLALAVGLLQVWLSALPLITLWLALVVLLGLLEKYYALRVAFDADLFHTASADARTLPDTTAALDQALTALRLQPADKAGRPWAVRSQGALGLLRRQLVLVLVQLLVLLAPLLVFPLLH